MKEVAGRPDGLADLPSPRGEPSAARSPRSSASRNSWSFGAEPAACFCLLGEADLWLRAGLLTAAQLFRRDTVSAKIFFFFFFPLLNVFYGEE